MIDVKDKNRFTYYLQTIFVEVYEVFKCLSQVSYNEKFLEDSKISTIWETYRILIFSFEKKQTVNSKITPVAVQLESC